MMMAMAGHMKPNRYPVSRLEDFDDGRISSTCSESTESRMEDRFQTMFEASDRTQAVTCGLNPSSMIFRNAPLAKVEERGERLRRSCSTTSTATSELSSSGRNTINNKNAEPNAIAAVVKLQAAVRSFLARTPKEAAPPIRTIRPRHKCWSRMSDVTMHDLGDSFASGVTASSRTMTDAEGSGEFTMGAFPYPRSRNQSIDTMSQSADGDVNSFALKNNQSIDTFDVFLEHELRHLDISGEIIQENTSGSCCGAVARGCTYVDDVDDDGSESMPSRPPVIGKRQVSLDTTCAVAPDGPAAIPTRRESQYMAHDVSSLTEGSSRSDGGSRGKGSSKKKTKLPKRMGNAFVQRFCAAPVMPNMKRISLDLPLGLPKRRDSKQVFRTSAPAALYQE